tara:strand:- start:1748 stop:2680 length:933 start_codon:yes stop_codon:yes gene_type:complete
MVVFDKHIFLNSITTFEIPADLSPKDLSYLLNQYPAFNSIQLLNAVLTHKKDPELFNKKLSKVATKVIDRAILHDYIFKNKFTFKQVNLSTAKEQAEILVEDVNKSTGELVDTQTIEEVKEEQSDLEKIRLAKKLKTKNNIAKLKKKAKKAIIVQTEEKQEKKLFSDQAPHAKNSDFLKWLKEINTNKPVFALETKRKAVEKKKAIEEKEDLIPFEKVSGIEHEMHQEIKKSTDPLDDFISNQIAKKKVVRTKNTTKVSTNVGLISETLAQILVVQQKYTEAIEVYNTLSLKYPEKSIYFAHQIEKIKNY